MFNLVELFEISRVFILQATFIVGNDLVCISSAIPKDNFAVWCLSHR
jgi:hypothetical protein